MNCLHLIHRYWPAQGGSEKFMIEISERLARDGNRVDVFTTDAIDIQHYWLPDKEKIEIPREEHNGVDIHRFKVHRFPKHAQVLRVLGKIPGLMPKSNFSFPSPMIPGMFREIQNNGSFDIVHATALPYDAILYAGHVASRKYKIPFVISPFLHLGEQKSDEVRRYYTRPHQMELLRSADIITVQTDIERDFLIDSGFSEKRLLMLGMGINPEELSGGDGERFRAKYDIIGPIVCYIGPKTYDKGTFHLVEAMESLWHSGDPSNLVMAGKNIEDFRRYHEKLPEKIKSKCIMMDYIPEQDKLDLLDACELLVLPSRSDSFGIVFLEAWYYGKPVIGARAGGIPGLVRDEVDGLLVPFGGVKELSAAISALLTDKTLAGSLGEAGRKRVLEHYKWDDKYDIIKALYMELIGGRRVD
ncbi:MAG: glycosyltransferase family 4 protein [Actinobacteria bacterium]|nr:glycosyltransferase family 4 protein [Actinomycetota bacterium]